MKAHIAIAIGILVILAISVQPASAVSVISIPFVSTNCMTFVNPNSNTALTIEEFNSASTTSSDLEAININFPLSADGINAGPTLLQGSSAIDGVNLAGSATSNVLPFGPVNLAFPDISQTVAASCNSQQTYFFTDNFS